jgi:hypothetical protein
MKTEDKYKKYLHLTVAKNQIKKTNQYKDRIKRRELEKPLRREL